jgi:hypothetical protein
MKRRIQTTGTIKNPVLTQQILDAFDAGLHQGYRPAHAKGLTCSGTFTPLTEAAILTCATHASKPSTPVTVVGRGFLIRLTDVCDANRAK